MAQKVNDPGLLAELDAPVSDPALLAELEGGAPPAKMDTQVNRWVQKAGEGFVPGYNRMAAASQALLDRIGGYGSSFRDQYGARLRALQGQSADTQREHPWASAGATGVGAVGSALLAAPARAGTATVEAIEGLPRLTRALQAMKEGAGIGAMYGAGDAPADAGIGTIASQTALGAAAGGLTGGALGALMPAHVPANPSARIKEPRIPTTKPAATLRREGVDLTSGQMAGPDSIIGQLEAVSSGNPMGMGAERQAAKDAFQRVAQNKGAAPGQPIPKDANLQTRLDELFRGFDAAYAPFKKAQVPPEALESLPSAATVPGRGVDARTATGAKAEIENALTVLGKRPQAPAPSGLLDASGVPIPAPLAPPMTATVGDLMKVRENIRAGLRDAVKAQDFDKMRILGHAEDVVTGSIESTLGPEEQAALRAVDKQYARLMPAANAAPGGQTNFTPGQYLRQVEKASGKRAFKRGGAGDLQDLGEAALGTFVDAPLTGYRGAVLGSIPGANYMAAPAMRWLNTPAAKRFLFDTRSLPIRGSGPGSAATTDPAVVDFLQMLRGRQLTPVSAGADEESR